MRFGNKVLLERVTRLEAQVRQLRVDLEKYVGYHSDGLSKELVAESELDALQLKLEEVHADRARLRFYLRWIADSGKASTEIKSAALTGLTMGDG